MLEVAEPQAEAAALAPASSGLLTRLTVSDRSGGKCSRCGSHRRVVVEVGGLGLGMGGLGGRGERWRGCWRGKSVKVKRMRCTVQQTLDTVIHERSEFLREGVCGNCIRCFDTPQNTPPLPTATALLE